MGFCCRVSRNWAVKTFISFTHTSGDVAAILTSATTRFKLPVNLCTHVHDRCYGASCVCLRSVRVLGSRSLFPSFSPFKVFATQVFCRPSAGRQLIKVLQTICLKRRPDSHSAPPLSESLARLHTTAVALASGRTIFTVIAKSHEYA